MSGEHPEEQVRHPVCRQWWKNLTFLHWAYPPERLRSVLPEGLELDIWDGMAWVSITPFVMVDFRIGRLPPLPGMWVFPETNVRTYVRGPDGRDGIWFLSLEADNLPTVVGASSLYGVPYRWADMTVDQGEEIRYRSRRRRHPEVGHDISIRTGNPCPAPSDHAHWLTGRWRAYTTIAGRLAQVPVHHPPWPLWDARVVALKQSLLAAAGLPEPDGEPSVQYSPGVEVRLGAPHPV